MALHRHPITDHAVAKVYNPTAPKVTAKPLCLSAITHLFEYLPISKKEGRDEDYFIRLQLIAFSSLCDLRVNMGGGMGLSHCLG